MTGALMGTNEIMYIVFLFVGLIGGVIFKKVLEKVKMTQLRKKGYFQVLLLDAGKILRTFYARPNNGSITIQYGGKEKTYLLDLRSDVGHTEKDNLPIVMGGVDDTLLLDLNTFLNQLEETQRNDIEKEIQAIQKKVGRIIPLTVINRTPSLAPDQFSDQINVTTRLTAKIGGAIKEKMTPTNIIMLILIGAVAALSVMNYQALQGMAPTITHLNTILAAKT
jgi:hypothetical protein